MIWLPFANNVLRLAIRDMRDDRKYLWWISRYRRMENVLMHYISEIYPYSLTGLDAKWEYEQALETMYGTNIPYVTREQALLALYYAEDATRPWWRKRLTMAQE